MASADRELVDRFGPGDPVVVARAPGRVNLIGEHTDYNQGFVLPTTLDRFVEVAVRRRSGENLRLLAIDVGETVELALGGEIDRAGPSWVPYVFGTVEELRRRGLIDAGCDLALRGTVLQGAGLSSSAALETATLLALEAAYGFALEPLEAVDLCHRVEHRWAGVRCGVMDQMASRLGLADHALLVDCRDLSYRHVPLSLGEHALVVIDSGVRRRLADSAYNERREDCEEGVALLSQGDRRIRSLRDIDAGELDARAVALPTQTAARCRHVVEENVRVLDAARCLEAGQLEGFGRLMVESHRSLRDLYEVSHPALDRLVEEALEVDGVLGSRLTGAGFGGCTVTLCRRTALSKLRDCVERVFCELDLPGRFLEVGPAVGAGTA